MVAIEDGSAGEEGEGEGVRLESGGTRVGREGAGG